MFWLWAALLVLAGAGFAIWPFLRPRTSAPMSPLDQPQAVVRAVYQDRIEELEAEALAGQIDPETRSEVQDELGASLLDDYRTTAARVSVLRGRGRSARAVVAAGLLAVLLPAASFWVYLTAGEPTALIVAGAGSVLRLDPEADRDELRDWRDRLTRRVARHADDAQSWYLLGVTRLQLGEFAASADAFAAAQQRVGHDPNIDLYWLQARYLAAGGVMDEPSLAIADRLLAARPGHPLVLEMFAIDAYRRGDFRAAVEHLNRALNNSLAPGQLMALLGGLEQARRHLGDLNPSVDVAVSAPGGAPRDATVFVIARPPGGGMPYAVVRRPAGLLPLSVRLDDTVSMSRELPLSDAPAIEVVVRLSRNGTPSAGPGDWEWRSAPLTVADLTAPLRLEAELAPPRSEPNQRTESEG
jgi:cytochrome c-type biogenesis protein CcmH